MLIAESFRQQYLESPVDAFERLWLSRSASPVYRTQVFHDPPVRLVGQQLDHLGVQFRRFGIYRRFAEQSWIERARVCHGSLLGAQSRYDIVS